jgi:broad specificity phosphatase PhoE
MARIVLVRHGQTAWNREQIFRGRADLPLSEHGHAQARAVGDHLAGLDVAAIHSSPMLRARQTAEPLAQAKGLPILDAPGLIDADFGAWQGLAIPQVEEKYPDIFRLWQAEPAKVKFPGGESYRAIARRAAAEFDRLARDAGDGTIVVVAHRFINKVVLCALLGIVRTGFWRIKQDTACLNVIAVEGGGPVVESLNFTAHLDRLRTGREIDF